MTVKERLQQNAALVERELDRLMAREDVDFSYLLAAERYSLLAPRAKRIRPTLVLEFCRMLGGTDKAALPFAAAVEMVHTYSLIHDDLPCMDNDDLRRGRPTCHKEFDEATALLAGDGLLTRAFGLIAENDAVSHEQALAAVAALSRAAGSFGMIGGQVIDLRGEREPLTKETLLKLHAHKTGALIAVSAELGCLAAGVRQGATEIDAACAFAKGVGLAFQIVDDVLDATSSTEELGKPVGSDSKSHKTTFLSFYTPEEALSYARRVSDEAKKALSQFDHADFLTALADYLIDRRC
ncbi:MAG: polyprenyl synthetase family protein [Ruminococcaceae bacterium]|nr:polyprenyl synthetase family protein [Oscillospiraceae bacterium]